MPRGRWRFGTDLARLASAQAPGWSGGSAPGFAARESRVRDLSPHRRTGKLLTAAGIGALVWVVVLALRLAGFLEPFELKLYDRLCRMSTSPAPPTGEIALVTVDDGSLEAAAKELGVTWPWPRQMYVPIVQFCKAAGARAVLFDILFSEDSSYGVEDDRLLADALAQNGRAILSLFLSGEDRPQEEWQGRLIERLALPLENHTLQARPSHRSAQTPIRLLAEKARTLANVDIPPDQDGIYRRVPLVFPYGTPDTHWLPAPGLAAAWEVLGREKLVLDSEGLELSSLHIPLDRQGNFLLTFYGGERDFPRYSAFNLIQSFVALEAGGQPLYGLENFRDKIVVVGLTAAGLLDLKPTPIRSVYPGMAIHATLAANLLHRDFRVRISPAAALTLAAATAVVAAATVIFLTAVWHLGVATLAEATALALAVTTSFRHHLWVDGVMLGITLGLAFAFAAVVSYATEGRQKRQIKKMFSHYMSEHLIHDLLKHPEKLRLGGEKRLLTVFFSDLAGFTSLSEKLTPEDVVTLLNRYLTAMTDIILAGAGLIDKYEGDAIMALWGAPLPQEDHAARACLAALQNQRRLAELRREFQASGLPPVYSRIGVNTGEMIIGNMGSTQRFDFTVIGDSVNLASRLEGANKTYGTGIIISEDTYRYAAAQIEARELDLLRVKGKEVPVRIYELLAAKGELDSKMGETRDRFTAGLGHYRRQEWTEALRCFRQALEAAPDDGPSRVFIERCREFIERPPPPSWDGVYRLTSK
jgi:adenylate cyclase